MFNIKVLVDSVLWLVRFQSLVHRWGLLAVSSHREDKGIFAGSVYKALIPFMRVLSSGLNTLERPHFLIPSCWGLRFKHRHCFEEGLKHSDYSIGFFFFLILITVSPPWQNWNLGPDSPLLQGLCWMFSSITRLYPPESSTRNVSRHCQMSLGEQNPLLP